MQRRSHFVVCRESDDDFLFLFSTDTNCIEGNVWKFAQKTHSIIIAVRTQSQLALMNIVTSNLLSILACLNSNMNARRMKQRTIAANSIGLIRFVSGSHARINSKNLKFVCLGFLMLLDSEQQIIVTKHSVRAKGYRSIWDEWFW